MDATTIGVTWQRVSSKSQVANAQWRSWRGTIDAAAIRTVCSRDQPPGTWSWKRCGRRHFWARVAQTHGASRESFAGPVCAAVRPTEQDGPDVMRRRSGGRAQRADHASAREDVVSKSSSRCIGYAISGWPRGPRASMQCEDFSRNTASRPARGARTVLAKDRRPPRR